jgi:hypothetical protein
VTQYGRPSADTYLGNWEDEAAGTTNIYDGIDEVTPSDADYIVSDSAPSTSPYVCKLTTVTDPATSSGHIVRYRYGKDAAGGAQIDIVVQLREGYVNEGTPGTLIKAWTHTNVSDTLTTAAQTLSAGEADSITDYSDLFLRFTADQP